MKKIYENIADFAKNLDTKNLEESIKKISDEARVVVKSERCSIFMVDVESNMLWSKHSDGIGKIAIALDSGIAGDTYQQASPQVVNDPYSDPRFLSKIDEKTGFVTRNILTIPIFSSKRDVIGVIQLLNKDKGDFSSDDVENLEFFSSYVSGALELALMS